MEMSKPSQSVEVIKIIKYVIREKRILHERQ